MNSWHRFRLLACIVVMLGIVVAGGFARLAMDASVAPYGWSRGWKQVDGYQGRRYLSWKRKLDPFIELQAKMSGDLWLSIPTGGGPLPALPPEP